MIIHMQWAVLLRAVTAEVCPVVLMAEATEELADMEEEMEVQVMEEAMEVQVTVEATEVQAMVEEMEVQAMAEVHLAAMALVP